MPSAACEVKDGAAAYVPASSGVDVTPGNQVVIRLASQAGVDAWSIACLTVDDTSNASTVNAGLVIDSILKTATIAAAGAAGKAWRFKSTVQSGGVKTESIFVLYTKVNGLRVHALDETTESNAVAGWGADINALIRNPPGTGGTTPTGTGLRKVSGGVEAAAASLLVDADVSTSAAIAASKIAFGGAVLALAAGYLTLNASPATSGFMRAKSGLSTPILTIDDGVGGTRSPLININNAGGPSLDLGIAAFNTNVSGAATTVLAQSGDVTLTAGSLLKATASGLSVIDTGSGTIFVGVTSAGNNKFTNVKIAPSALIMMGAPVGGDASATAPFRWTKATIQPTSTNAVTLTAAQAACKILLFKTGGGVTAAVTVTATPQDGEPHIIKNRCGFNVTIGGVTVANGADAHISYDSDAAAWGRCT